MNEPQSAYLSPTLSSSPQSYVNSFAASCVAYTVLHDVWTSRVEALRLKSDSAPDAPIKNRCVEPLDCDPLPTMRLRSIIGVTSKADVLASFESQELFSY